jgi:hypothetical protein
LPEVGGKAAHYFDPTNETEALEVIADLLLTPAKLQELREAGIRRAAEYSWKRAAREMFTVFDRVCGRA